MSDMVKCIGGPMDGKYVEQGERVMALYPEPDFVSVLDFNIDIQGSETCDMPQPTLYKLRSVRCEGSEIWFYAPNDWTDLRALQQALA